MQVTVNDQICLAGEIFEQPVGSWRARIEVDSEANKLKRAVTIKVGEASFVATVVRGDVPEGKGRWVGQLVGGAGGLDRIVDAKYYRQSALRSVVQDVLAAGGETLDTAGSDPSALSLFLTRWSRTKGTVRQALTAIAKKAGAFWRMTRAGKVVLLKADTWREVKFAYDYIDADPTDGKIEIAPGDAPQARPGISVGEHKAASVTTSWDGGGVRQIISLARDDGTPSGDGPALVAAIKSLTDSAINYSQWYPSKVIVQQSDGSLDLLPDDPRVRGQGLTNVPLKTGIPGLSVKVLPGTYVRLFFENGSPSEPAAALADHASGVLEVQLQASVKVSVIAPQINLGAVGSPPQSNLNGELLLAYIDGINNAIVAALSAITPGPASSGGGPAVGVFQGIVQGLAAAKQAALSQIIKVQ